MVVAVGRLGGADVGCGDLVAERLGVADVVEIELVLPTNIKSKRLDAARKRLEELQADERRLGRRVDTLSLKLEQVRETDLEARARSIFSGAREPLSPVPEAEAELGEAKELLVALSRARQLAEEETVAALDEGRERFLRTLELDARTRAQDALKTLDELDRLWREWMAARAADEWLRAFSPGNPRPYRVGPGWLATLPSLSGAPFSWPDIATAVRRALTPRESPVETPTREAAAA